MKIFRGDDVGRGLRPALRHFHIFLAENRLALFVADQRHAAFPLDRVKRRGAAVGEIPLELEAGADLDIRGHRAGLERRLLVQSHFRMCHLRLRAGRLPRAEGTLIFYSRNAWLGARSYLILSRPLLDSILSAGNSRASFYGLKFSLDAFRVKVESAPEKRKKPPLRIAPAACGLWRYAIPRRPRWERRPRGVKESLLDVSMNPDRLRQSTLRCSRGEWAVRLSNHDP